MKFLAFLQLRIFPISTLYLQIVSVSPVYDVLSIPTSPISDQKHTKKKTENRKYIRNEINCAHSVCMR